MSPSQLMMCESAYQPGSPSSRQRLSSHSSVNGRVVKSLASARMASIRTFGSSPGSHGGGRVAACFAGSTSNRMSATSAGSRSSDSRERQRSTSCSLSITAECFSGQPSGTQTMLFDTGRS